MLTRHNLGRKYSLNKIQYSIVKKPGQFWTSTLTPLKNDFCCVLRLQWCKEFANERILVALGKCLKVCRFPRLVQHSKSAQFQLFQTRICVGTVYLLYLCTFIWMFVCQLHIYSWILYSCFDVRHVFVLGCVSSCSTCVFSPIVCIFNTQTVEVSTIGMFRSTSKRNRKGGRPMKNYRKVQNLSIMPQMRWILFRYCSQLCHAWGWRLNAGETLQECLCDKIQCC